MKKDIMKSLLQKFNHNLWVIKVATFCRYNRQTHLWLSFYNGNLKLLGRFFPTLSEVSRNVLNLQVVLLSSFSRVHPKPAQWGLGLATVLPLHHLKPTVLFFSFKVILTAWMYVLDHYLAVRWTPEQLGVDQRRYWMAL